MRAAKFFEKEKNVFQLFMQVIFVIQFYDNCELKFAKRWLLNKVNHTAAAKSVSVLNTSEVQ